MNNPLPSGAHPKGALASRPVLARLIVLLLGMLGALAALELGLAVSGRIYRWRYEQRAVPSDGKTVILCLGDSFTEGIGAPPGQSYPDQLEALLNQGAERKYRVVNAGRSTTNTAIAKGIFLERVDKVKPRIVTLMIGPANYWNYVGYHPAEQSRLERLFVDACRRIRVIKLARLLLYQSRRKSPPGFQVSDGAVATSGSIPSDQVSRAAGSPHLTEPPGPVSVSMGPDGFWSDWSKGLVRCRGAVKRGREVRPDLTPAVVPLLELQQVEEAQKRVQEFLRSQPPDGRVHALMGFIHLLSSDLDQARASFENARRLDPHDGYAQMGMVAVSIGSDPDYKAFEPISRIISEAPEDALLSRVAGYLLKENNDYVGAVAMLEKSLRLDPCQSRSFVLLGMAYGNMGRWDEAQAMGRETFRLDPSNPDASVLVQIAPLLKKGRYEEVFRFCRSRGPDDPGGIRTCLNTAESLLRSDTSEEMALMREALSFGPSNPDASVLVQIAHLLMKGQYEEVFRFCRLRCSRDPNWIKPCSRAAELLLRRGIFSAGALPWVRDMARLYPNDLIILSLLAKEERLYGRTQEANAIFARVAEMRPKDARPVVEVARAYLTPPEHPKKGEWALSGKHLALDALAFFAYWDELRSLPMESVLASPTQVFERPRDRVDMVSWIRNDIRSIAAECRRRGIRLVIMNYPRRTEFLGYQDLAASAGALFVDVQKAFEPLRADGSEARYFVPNGHCNAAGYGIIARTLSQEMRMAGLLP